MASSSRPAEQGAKLHHFGFVVRSIASDAASFIQALEAEWDGNIVYDKLQDVRVTFLRPGIAPSPEIELVEPSDAQSPVTRFLNAGGGLHHVCYEVADLEQQLNGLPPSETLIVREPLPAVAFGGRLISWVRTRKGLLIEYLQR
jgi:methylmalonyl-CoA/ethylmalonyl-CoA epimerase